MTVLTEPQQTPIQPTSADRGVQRFRIEGRIYTRTAPNRWAYGDTGVAVPGSRDLRLADLITPGPVMGVEVNPDAFLISADQVARMPELAWCASEGSAVEIAQRAHFLIDAATWAKHADALCGVYAPELHGTPEEKMVAQAERDFRLAQRAAEIAAFRRARAFEAAAARGMTRRALAAVVDLSATRIQQLASDTTPDADLDPTDDEAHLILDVVARSPHIELAELQGIDADSQRSTRAAAQRLLQAGLLTTSRTSDTLVLTDAGRQYMQHGRNVSTRDPAAAQPQ